MCLRTRAGTRSTAPSFRPPRPVRRKSIDTDQTGAPGLDGEADPVLQPVQARLLARLADGDTNRQAADTLSISVSLLEKEILNCRKRLGVTDRAHLVHTAYTTGILPHPGAERRLWLLVATASVADIAGVLGVPAESARSMIRDLRALVGAKTTAHLVRLGHVHGVLGCATVCAAAPGVALSYGRLAESAEPLRRLAWLPVCDLDPALAAAVCGEVLSTTGWALEVLTDENLLTEHTAAGRPGDVVYRLTEGVRAYARNRSTVLDPPSFAAGTLRRACDWYLHGIFAAHRRLCPEHDVPVPVPYLPPVQPVVLDDAARALQWLLAHQEPLEAMLLAAGEQGWSSTLWTVAELVTPMLAPRSDDVWACIHRPGLLAARKANRPGAVRRLLHAAALGQSAAGRFDDAYTWYVQLLEAAASEGDARDEGQALWGLGYCRLRSGRVGDAAEYLHQAHRVWRNCGYHAGLQQVRLLLAEVALADGDTERVMDLLTDPPTGLPHTTKPRDASRAQALLGYAKALHGRPDAGVRDMLAALTRLETMGDIPGQARAHALLGAAAGLSTYPISAERYYRRAAALYTLVSPAEATHLHDRLTRRLQPSGRTQASDVPPPVTGPGSPPQAAR
ncbi:hypothetical protein ACIQVO_37240 [Streptomyces sp. NPDC101062]|uniref:hypothetical protein n=1 Tax=unclassified Streptomyces TaxID=2593676 RepID=UPI003820B7AC